MPDGSVLAWGDNRYGQLGVSGLGEAHTPATVSGISGATSIAAGGRRSLARTSSGGVKEWGNGSAIARSVSSALESPVLGGEAGTELLTYNLGFQQAFYGHDTQGNVRFLTNSLGTLTDSYAYDAFGNLIERAGTTDNPYLYQGERFDAETGLYHLRAREYDPRLGRFQQVDSFAGFVGSPGSHNRYVYAEGDPVNQRDPSGHFATSIVEAMIDLYQYDDYLSTLASIGPAERTLSLDDWLADPLKAAAGVRPTIVDRERPLWVNATTAGNILGSLSEESGAVVRGSTAFSQARGLGGGSDVFFLTKSGARFRQSPVERIVESSWVTVQRAWPSLNTGPKQASDIGRKLSVKWQNRWPDVLYHNSILQGALRSAFFGCEVEANITRTMRAPSLLPHASMSLNAEIALSPSAGGGPLTWRDGNGTIDGTFLTRTRGNAWEYGTLDQFRDFEDGAMSSRAYGVATVWAHALPGVAAYEFYHNAREGGAGFGLALWGAALSSVPGVSGTYQLAGYDLTSGEDVYGWTRALGALDVGLAAIGGASGVESAFQGAGKLARQGGRLAASATESAIRAADRAFVAAAERANGAARWASSAARKAATRGERIGANFAEGFTEAYRDARRAQLSRLSADPLLGLGNEAGNLAEGISGGVKRAFGEARIAERQSAELLGRDGADIAEYASEAAENAADGSVRFKRWKRGDAIDKPLPDGSAPDWETVQSRYWKNRHMAAKNTGEFTPAQLDEMKKGNAPFDFNPRTGQWERRELHHVDPQRHTVDNSPLNLRELTPDWHAEVDPLRKVPGVQPNRGIR